MDAVDMETRKGLLTAPVSKRATRSEKQPVTISCHHIRCVDYDYSTSNISVSIMRRQHSVATNVPFGPFAKSVPRQTGGHAGKQAGGRARSRLGFCL